MSTLVELLSIRPVPNTSNLRAFASVRIGNITIHDCRIVQQPGQQAWVSLPQREYTTKGGERKFSAVIELSEPLRREVLRAVLAAWEREVGHE
jgi:DNA-binding cell septation regulator SpoVG